MHKTDLIVSLTNWIDKGVIAGMIVTSMEENKTAMCLDDAKTIWNDCLEHELGPALDTACRYAHLDKNGMYKDKD